MLEEAQISVTYPPAFDETNFKPWHMRIFYREERPGWGAPQDSWESGKMLGFFHGISASKIVKPMGFDDSHGDVVRIIS